jgi:hypothetical protein
VYLACSVLYFGLLHAPRDRIKITPIWGTLPQGIHGRAHRRVGVFQAAQQCLGAVPVGMEDGEDDLRKHWRPVGCVDTYPLSCIGIHSVDFVLQGMLGHLHISGCGILLFRLASVVNLIVPLLLLLLMHCEEKPNDEDHSNKS